MNIRELKELIKDLSDEMPVLEARDGAAYCGTDEREMEVRTVWYGTRKGYRYKDEDVSWIEPGFVEKITDYHEALVMRTYD